MPDAVILPFPAPRLPVGRMPAASSDTRLDEALAGLQSALAEQALAVKAWRFAMAELGVGVAGLGQAMAAYDGSLSALDQQLTSLRGNAEALGEAADRARMF